MTFSGSKMKRNLLTTIGNPSPTTTYRKKDLAQNAKCASKRSPGATLLGKILVGRVWAGMTVEAVLALPVFLFFFLNIASIMEMIRLYGNMQLALWGAGNEVALYGCVSENEEMAALLSPVYIKTRIVSDLGEEYLAASPVVDGADGVFVWEDLFGENEDVLDVTVSYGLEPVSDFIGFRTIRMKNRYYAHIWNGYRLPEKPEHQEMVYVTETGAVYHSNRDCTHLQLSIREVAAEKLEQTRNQWGRSYGACEKCSDGEIPELLYVTAEGECYHYQTACSGLKRTVFVLELTEALKKYRSCSRCAGA